MDETARQLRVSRRWLLEGRTVIALTANDAAIQSPSGYVTIYRKLNKPATAWGS